MHSFMVWVGTNPSQQNILSSIDPLNHAENDCHSGVHRRLKLNKVLFQIQLHLCLPTPRDKEATVLVK